MANSMAFGQPNTSPGVNPGGVDVLYSELWRACAGPLVEIPRSGERVYYFPQGHMEQLEASTNEELNQRMHMFNLPSKILCRVMDVLLLFSMDVNKCVNMKFPLKVDNQESQFVDTEVQSEMAMFLDSEEQFDSPLAGKKLDLQPPPVVEDTPEREGVDPSLYISQSRKRRLKFDESCCSFRTPQEEACCKSIVEEMLSILMPKSYGKREVKDK